MNFHDKYLLKSVNLKIIKIKAYFKKKDNLKSSLTSYYFLFLYNQISNV